MKKIISLLLAMVLVAGVAALAGCGNNETPDADNDSQEAVALKFGMGVFSRYEAMPDADGDTVADGEYLIDIAAVLVDADGKIVKCVLDAVDNKAQYNSKGEFVEAGEFKTKYEMLDDYNMVAYGGAQSEWYEQADAFAKLCEGKTLAEVEALAATGADAQGKGTEEVINAGCTIAVVDFIEAIKDAVNNAAESKATAGDTLKIGVVSAQDSDSKNATDEANGENVINTTIACAAIGADGKVTAMKIDEAVATFTFDAEGKSTMEASAELKTKNQLGTAYNMSAYGQDLNGDGKVLEWNEQADALAGLCIGKTATEISAMALDTGYGDEAVQTAGCTIAVSTMVKTVVKAATV